MADGLGRLHLGQGVVGQAGGPYLAPTAQVHELAPVLLYGRGVFGWPVDVINIDLLDPEAHQGLVQLPADRGRGPDPYRTLGQAPAQTALGGDIGPVSLGKLGDGRAEDLF